jgi:hypothetical protein
MGHPGLLVQDYVTGIPIWYIPNNGDGGEVDGDGRDGDGDRWRWLRGYFPVLAGCRNRDFCPPKFVFDGSGTAELFWEKCRLF